LISLNYLKDGNFISSDGIKDLLKKKTYGHIITEATSQTDFIRLVEEHFPRDAVLNYEKIKLYAEHKFKETTPEYVSPFSHEDFPNALQEMNDWVRETLSMPRPNPMVYIKGPASRPHKSEQSGVPSVRPPLK
jgi:hypothetical protein